jgi:hypothetical protein
MSLFIYFCICIWPGATRVRSEAMAKDDDHPFDLFKPLSKTSCKLKDNTVTDYPCEQQKASHSLIQRALLSFLKSLELMYCFCASWLSRTYFQLPDTAENKKNSKKTNSVLLPQSF